MKGKKTARVVVGVSLMLSVVGVAAVASAVSQSVDSGIAAVEQYVQPEAASVGIAAAQEQDLVRITDPVIRGCDFITEIVDAKGAYCMDDLTAKGMPEVQAYELAGRIAGKHYTAEVLADFVADGGVDGVVETPQT